MKKKELAVKMRKSELIREHKHLVKVLRTGKGQKQELKKQSKELKQYEH